MSLFGGTISKGRSCCVPRCNSRMYGPDGCKTGIHFFRIPGNVILGKQLKTEWCRLIKRIDGKDNFRLTATTSICSEHFHSGKFEECDKNHEDADEKRNETIKSVEPEPASQQPDDRNAGDHAYFSSAYGKLQTSVEILNEKVAELNKELQSAYDRIESLQAEINLHCANRFGVNKIKDDNDAMLFYTGFQNYGVFRSVFEYLESKAENLQYWRGKSEESDHKSYQTNPGSKPGPNRKLDLEEEFFMVLVRMRVGLFVRDLSDRFSISQSYFSKLFTTWVIFLHAELPQLFPFPSQDAVYRAMPSPFKKYPTTRIILDCTEIFIEVPSTMLAQSQTWSNYKQYNTYKVLVGVAPTGNVTFVSELWGGRASDKEITLKSGVHNFLEPGDNVMADRGFEIADILPSGVTLNIPPFKGNAAQLTAEQVQNTMDIASVRIHVERAIGRIKNYHILDGIIPLSLSHIANQIFTVIAYLTCFLPPLVAPGKEE
ncbi:hypothetical protein FSP39_005462 [Pinctada imbricata]|uniref:THAP-type domain-containing protein n=1 Tax=Pinctada imbricata TaxID=66713 RepID=A0AA88XSJ6_PINIB|nr:hypothetical protein FSP39_005462 [Pinctada imbricata]